MKSSNKARICGFIAGVWTAFAAAEIDLSDFDTFLMQDMDATVKDLEPLIGGKDVAAAKEAVTFLLEGLAWTQDYFASKAGADDAVGFARAGKESAEATLAALDAKDFNGAAEAARNVARSCRQCHDVYRP